MVTGSLFDILAFAAAWTFFTWVVWKIRSERAAPEGFATARASLVHSHFDVETPYRYRYRVDGQTFFIDTKRQFTAPAVHYDPARPDLEPILITSVTQLILMVALGWLFILSALVSFVL